MFADDRRPRGAYVLERFELDPNSVRTLERLHPEFGFDGFGEFVFYRTYSRRKADGTQESWADVVRRVVEGCFSIRKDWARRRELRWDEGAMQALAWRMADAVFHMRFLPPGRGLYAMGTNYVYERGSMALFNCGAVEICSSHLADDLAWCMDALMCGVGVGAGISHDHVHVEKPGLGFRFYIADSREGWVASVRALVAAYTRGTARPLFDYGGIREKGQPLRGIGGVASGPEPLRILHGKMTQTLDRYLAGDISPLRLRADLVNQIGCAVDMGDIRRSAEMLIGPAGCDEFLALKDYERNPDRAEWGWVSNNTVRVTDLSQVPAVARAIADLPPHVEKPGVLNLPATQACGDRATLVNPCGEIPLEPFELCNVVEVVPVRCVGVEETREALELAAFYAQTVSILPTHSAETNRVLYRNRRIGVSRTGASAEFDLFGALSYRQRCGNQREIVEAEANRWARDARVIPPLKVTTMKPSGTISQLAGVTSGMHWAVDNFAIRRARVGASHPIRMVLEAAGLRSQEDHGLRVYEFPIRTPGRVERDVPLAEQFRLHDLLQTAWADNSVSCTLKFNESERAGLAEFLCSAIPRVKTISVMAHAASGSYNLAPYEAISEERYLELRAKQPKVDWSLYHGGDGEEPTFCDASGKCGP